MSFPSLGGEIIVANPDGVFRHRGGKVEKLEMDKSKFKEGKFSTVWAYKKKDAPEPGRLGIGMQNTLEHVDQRDIYSNTEWLRRFVNHEIPGFMTQGGHVNDHTVAVWMAQKFGAEAEYASGREFDLVLFGDLMIDGKRDPPRDPNGLLIAGLKDNPYFERYAQMYRERNNS